MESSEDRAGDLIDSAVVSGDSTVDRGRILLIDGDELRRGELAHALRSRWSVDEAAHQATALDLVRTIVPDLVLVAVEPPGPDGVEVVGALRATPQMTSVPILLMTTTDGESSAIAGLEAGADDYLVRSPSIREVVGRVSPWLELARLRRQTRRRELEYAERVQRIAEASLAITSTLDLDELLQLIADRARAVIGANQAAISLVDDPGTWAKAMRATSLSEKYAAWHGFDEKPEGSGIYTLVTRLNRTMRMTQAELEAHPAWRRFGQFGDRHPPMRGWLAVPLLGHDGRSLGLIQLSDKEAGEFTDEDEAILIQIAQLASVAIENARLYQETQTAEERTGRQASRFHLLAEASHAFSAAGLDVGAVLEAVARFIGERLGDLCIIRLLSDDRTLLQTAAIHHANPEALALLRELHAEPQRADLGISGQVVMTELPLLRPSIDPAEVMAATTSQHRHYVERFGTYSLLVVPFRVRGRLAGALGVSRDTPELPYTVDDQALLTELAERASLAMEHARLYDAEQQARQAAERAVDRTARLQRISSALADAATPAEVADVVVEQGRAALGAAAGLVVLKAEDGSALETIRAAGYPPAIIKAWRRLPLDLSTPVGEAVLTGQAVWFNSRQATEGRYPRTAKVVDLLPGAVTAVPLLAEGRAVGGFGMAYASPRTFSDDDKAFAMTLARQCGQALERARLYEAEAQARAAAEAAVRARDEFLSLVSHDLKTPLASIKGQAQLLRRRATRSAQPPFAGLDEGLAGIDAAITRMTTLIGELLDVARLQGGQPLDLERRPTDLIALARQVAAEVQRTTDRHVVRVAATRSALTGIWDPFRLERVLANLLSNAVKYSPNGGAITVTVDSERAGAWAVITVRDHGVGIPAADLPRVFERFHRGANVAGRIAGTGIGLAGARQIVEQHGGTITVDSEEGVGSTFTLRLPVTGAAVNEVAEAPGAKGPG